MNRMIKKLAILNAAIAGAIFAAGFAFGADNDSIEVLMRVQVVSVVKASTNIASYSTGTSTGGIKVGGWVGFKNNSGGAEHFKIRIASVTGTWTLLENGDPSVKPGNDQFRLYAIWHYWASNGLVNKDEFQADDVLKLTDVASSSTTFFNNVEPTSHYDDPSTPAVEGANLTVASNPYNGMGVPDNSSRDLFFRYDAPATFTSGNSTMKATLTVTAISAE